MFLWTKLIVFCFTFRANLVNACNSKKISPLHIASAWNDAHVAAILCSAVYISIKIYSKFTITIIIRDFTDLMSMFPMTTRTKNRSTITTTTTAYINITITTTLMPIFMHTVTAAATATIMRTPMSITMRIIFFLFHRMGMLCQFRGWIWESVLQTNSNA